MIVHFCAALNMSSEVEMISLNPFILSKLLFFGAGELGILFFFPTTEFQSSQIAKQALFFFFLINFNFI